MAFPLIPSGFSFSFVSFFKIDTEVVWVVPISRVLACWPSEFSFKLSSWHWSVFSLSFLRVGSFALSLTPWGLQGCHSFQKFSLFGHSHGRVRLFFLLFWSLRLKISLGCPFPNPFGLDSLVGLFLRDPLSKIGFFVVYLSAFLC